MQGKSRVILFVTAFTVVFGFLTIAAPLFAASKEKVLYSFCTLANCPDGALPHTTLIFDAAGNLYGTTLGGGTYGAGTVFLLSRGAGGAWTETVLYNFCSSSDCADGAGPLGGLILDAAGDLYGTTSMGGAHDFGTVFQLAPGANGTWTETVLHSFNNNGKDGYYPSASLIWDATGNLYGTTVLGGDSSGCHGYSCGAAFELTPGADGKWTEKVLHSFNGADGWYPEASLIFDAAGSLYGTTYMGGAYGGGNVFKLMPRADGRWTEKAPHSFGKRHTDGSDPAAGVIFDAAGNLYGTTGSGGAYGFGGTLFQLTPGANDKWTEKILHSFNDNGKDGIHPYAGLILDPAGNLYGTTDGGGASACGYDGYGCGTIFELVLGTNGRWTEKVLHSFSNNGTDGVYPYGGLIFDAAGNLYGTTSQGGASGEGCYNYSGCGTVFEITP